LNTDKYTYLLGHPQHVKKEDREALANIIKKYPFFQSARALQLKALKNEDSFLYNEALKITAAHTTDRNILFNYITSKSFAQHEISQAILQHDSAVNELEVVSENVSEEISIAIDNQLKAERKKADAILNPDLFQKKLESIQHSLQNKKEKQEPASTPEEVLEVDKPLAFTKTDTHSFSEWLKLSKATPINRDREEKESKVTTPEQQSNDDENREKEKKFELIEKFIENGAKIRPQEKNQKGQQEKTEKINLAKPFTQSPETLMTETLAQVYVQQKKYSKAIQAYKILILKNPEKSGFFADRIRAIKNLINTEDK